MTSDAALDTDVLVVGAGPTGLMLACQLARRGIRTMIIDRHAGPSRETRALGVQARTLEIYQRLGVIERALSLGKRAAGANLWADGRFGARVPLGDIGEGLTPYPFVLILGQDDNERLLGERLRAFGLDVRWNTELLGLQQHDGHVAANLRSSDGGMRTLRAAWVAGCDGARSAVRELNDIGFPGAPYEHVFFVTDTVVTGEMVPDELNVYLWRSGFHLFFPMRGDDHWRLVGILPEGLRGRDDVRFEDVIPSLHAEAGALRFENCSWFSTYRIHHRRAARFRHGRCFLLGDAAHIHSPVGAQGMNTGLQDAYNLGWKLAAVIAHGADAALLDSYEQERLPVAQRLLDTTDRAFRLVVADNWVAAMLRTRVLARLVAFAMRRDAIRRRAFRVISQTGIHYRDGTLSVTDAALPKAAPQAGDRFPMLEEVAADDSGFTLVLVGQGSPGGIPTRVRVVELPEDVATRAALARHRIPSPAFYLLRPDGHVGLCGTRCNAGSLARYLRAFQTAANW